MSIPSLSPTTLRREKRGVPPARRPGLPPPVSPPCPAPSAALPLPAGVPHHTPAATRSNPLLRPGGFFARTLAVKDWLPGGRHHQICTNNDTSRSPWSEQDPAALVKGDVICIKIQVCGRFPDRRQATGDRINADGTGIVMDQITLTGDPHWR